MFFILKTRQKRLEKTCIIYPGPSSWDFSTIQFKILYDLCKYQWIPNILNLNAAIMNSCAYIRIWIFGISWWHASDEIEEPLPKMYGHSVNYNARLRNRLPHYFIWMTKNDFEWRFFDAWPYLTKTNASNMKLNDKPMKLTGKTYRIWKF